MCAQGAEEEWVQSIGKHAHQYHVQLLESRNIKAFQLFSAIFNFPSMSENPLQTLIILIYKFFCF